MGSAFLNGLIIIMIPIIVGIVGNYIVMHISGRYQFPQTTDPASKPLNLRWKGYSRQAAVDYWTWLQSNHAITTEKRFLKGDLVYPILYGGAMLVSLFLARVWLGLPVSPQWLVIPVIGTVLSDWTENLVHLNQLSRFVLGTPVKENHIQAASIATRAKLMLFSISSILIVGLGIGVILAHLKYKK